MTKTVGSQMSDFGLDLNIFTPDGSEMVVRHVNDFLSGYGHTIASFGGYLNASIKLLLPASEAEWWYDRALGLRVKLTCNGGQPVWEGFIDTISISAGGISDTRGPMMNIGNKIYVTYSPTNYDEDGQPVAGSEVITPAVDDLVSQGRYGILEGVISGGQCSDAMASYISAVAINDLAYPKISGPLSLPKFSNVEISLECLGLVYWLLAYIWDNAAAGSTTATAKILSILTGDPNGYLSSDYTKIYTNALPVGIKERNHRYAGDVIKEIVAMGDFVSVGTRTLFGIYEDARVFYNTMPNDIEYLHYLTWGNQVIIDRNRKNVIAPWLLRPGKWLMVPDFMFRVPPGTPLNMDYRTKFIESVNYTAPMTVDLSGGKVDKLSSLLAQITYSQGSSGGG